MNEDNQSNKELISYPLISGLMNQAETATHSQWHCINEVKTMAKQVKGVRANKPNDSFGVINNSKSLSW